MINTKILLSKWIAVTVFVAMLFTTACNNTVTDKPSDNYQSVQITELPVAYTASKVASVTAN